MQNATLIAISAGLNDRNDNHGSIVSDLASLIRLIRHSRALIESAIVEDSALTDEGSATNLVVLDDVTPGYLEARAALKACEAALGAALQCWVPQHRTF
jgi:hypothetical protein